MIVIAVFIESVIDFEILSVTWDGRMSFKILRLKLNNSLPSRAMN